MNPSGPDGGAVTEGPWDATPYDRIGVGYGGTRGTDPRIAAAIWGALGDAGTVLNVGAGTGSYEPPDRRVVAADPSAVMLAQRPPRSGRAVQAVAEALPFAEGAFDAAIGVLTVQHWTEPGRGLREVRRVCRGPVVLLTWDPGFDGSFWFSDRYFPQGLERDRARFPTIDRLAAALGGPARAVVVPIPSDCVDGFCGAFWARPEAFLDPSVRAGISTFPAIGQAATRRGLRRLAGDLASGEWDRRYGGLRTRAELDLGYRLVIGAASSSPNG